MAKVDIGQSRGLPQRITADAVVKAAAGRIWAIQLNGGTDASSLAFHNHVSSATGTQLIDIVAPCVTATGSEANSTFISYLEVGGIPFSTGIFVDWTGTSAVGYVWFE